MANWHARRKLGHVTGMSVILGLLLGCVTTQRLEFNADELRTEIRSGQLLRTGERIVVVTNERRHDLILTEIDADHLYGVERPKSKPPSGRAGSDRAGSDRVASHVETIAIPIDDVVAVQTVSVSAGKTALLVGTTAGVGLLFLIALASTPMFVL